MGRSISFVVALRPHFQLSLGSRCSTYYAVLDI